MLDITKTKNISFTEASSLLGVSTATVRNWIKSGHLSTYSDKSLNLSEVLKLKAGFESGQEDRLNSRANKRNSSTLFIPDEYISDQTVTSCLNEVLTITEENKLDKEKLLLTLSILLFEKAGLVKIRKNNEIDTSKSSPHILNELNDWLDELKDKSISSFYLKLKYLDIPTGCDFLGLIHQSLSAEGKKAQAGSYYTPKILVDQIVDEAVGKNDFILDPCCGTGQFLLSASDKIDDPKKIWGFDIDSQAVRIARINLLLKFSNINFSPNIYHKNTLTDLKITDQFSGIDLPKFDSIITNPPWGVHFSNKETEELKKAYPEIKSNEAFSYFIKKSHELLKNNGRLSFVLPESILNIKTHSDVRKLLLTQTAIEKIVYLDRVFKNVFTPVLRVDFIKTKPKNTHRIISQNKLNQYESIQSEYLKNADYTLNVFNSKEDTDLFNKIYKNKHKNLQDNAEWALGVVTGNNKKHLIAKRNRGLEPILTGKDIKRYTVKKAVNFIDFIPENFQQVAPTHKYRSKEKLLYKFISKQLVFAYDDKQILTLNSANVLIPKLDYPIKTILALFNSTPYQFIYQKKFGAIKVLRKDIENLPLPELNSDTHMEIEKMVDLLLKPSSSFKDRHSYHKRLDEYIMKILNFTKDEKIYVLKEVKNSDKLLELI